MQETGKVSHGLFGYLVCNSGSKQQIQDILWLIMMPKCSRWGRKHINGNSEKTRSQELLGDTWHLLRMRRSQDDKEPHATLKASSFITVSVIVNS